jgi:hypothetical protein
MSAIDKNHGRIVPTRYQEIRDMSKLPGELALDKIELSVRKASLVSQGLMEVATAFEAVGIKLSPREKLSVLNLLISGEDLSSILEKRISKGEE